MLHFLYEMIICSQGSHGGHPIIYSAVVGYLHRSTVSFLEKKNDLRLSQNFFKNRQKYFFLQILKFF